MCLSLALLMLLTAPPPCVFNRAHMPTPATHRKAPVCTPFALLGTLLGPFWSPMKEPCSFTTPLSAKRAQRGMGLSLMRFPGGFGVCVVSRTVSYGVLRCRTVSYGVVRCRTVSYGVWSVCRSVCRTVFVRSQLRTRRTVRGAVRLKSQNYS